MDPKSFPLVAPGASVGVGGVPPFEGERVLPGGESGESFAAEVDGEDLGGGVVAKRLGGARGGEGIAGGVRVDEDGCGYAVDVGEGENESRRGEGWVCVAG